MNALTGEFVRVTRKSDPLLSPGKNFEGKTASFSKTENDGRSRQYWLQFWELGYFNFFRFGIAAVAVQKVYCPKGVFDAHSG